MNQIIEVPMWGYVGGLFLMCVIGLAWGYYFGTSR
jgi:hypothetical protein